MKIQKLDLEVQWLGVRESLSKGRAKSLALLALLSPAFFLLLFSTAWIQVTQGAESKFISEAYFTSGREVDPPRGLFYDVNGKKLVINEDAYSVTAARQKLVDNEELIEDVSTWLDIDIERLQDLLEASTDPQVTLKVGLSFSEVLRLGDLEGLGLELVSGARRNYLYGGYYAHILGYTGQSDQQDVAAGYAPGDQLGKSGLESVLEDELKGVKGREVERVNSVEQINGVPGNNVYLTIDNDWQIKLFQVLATQVSNVGADSGAAVIVDTSNGDVKAMVGTPTFDPNLFIGGISSQQYQTYLDQLGSPLVDKVIGVQSPPGSTFKLVSAYAALQGGAIDENTHYFSNRCINLGGYDFCEYGRFYLGDLEIRRALSRSSNIFFCQSVLKLSSEQGIDVFVKAGRDLGIGSQTGILLPGELKGVMPSPDYKRTTFGESWYGGDTCNSSIGQGMVLTTPLQMAMMVSTLSNGGAYYKPNIISHVETQTGEVVKNDYREQVRQVEITDKTRELIMAGMYDVAHSPEGTAYRFLNSSPGNFRAKTGSAEATEYVNGQSRVGVHGWVVGTFEYDAKTYAFAVQLYFGGGGWNATPVIQRFTNCLYSGFTPGCDFI